MSREVIAWGRRDGSAAVPSDPGAPLAPSPVPPAGGAGAGGGTDLDGGEHDTWDDEPSPAGPAWLERLDGLDERGRRRLLGLTLAAATALGWLAAAVGPTDPTERPAPVVVATITENRSEPPSRGAASTTLRVALSNLSSSPVKVLGFDSAYVAADVTLLKEAGATVEPGTTLATDVNVTVLCSASSPLVLPTLLLRDGDGIEFPVVVAGAVQALADSCTGGDTPPVLSLAGKATVEDSRLTVPVANLGDRTVRLLAMTVDGVSFTGPLPATMDTPTKAVWLDPPRTCPDSWRASGLPTTLHLVVATTFDHRYDGEGTADIPLPVGPVLSQWLSSTACKAVP